MGTEKNKDVEVTLLHWIREARNQNIILIEPILQEKTKIFREALGIVCKEICGEEAVVDSDIVIFFLLKNGQHSKKILQKIFMLLYSEDRKI